MKKLDNAPMVIYRFICDYLRENNYTPTIREICSHVGLNSPATVHAHLKTLQNHGLIERDPFKHTFTICNAERLTGGTLPLLGSVAAGNPIGAIENIEDSFSVPQILTSGLSSDEAFMLHVKGNSMINAGIFDGDILVVGVGLSIEDGDIVVARIDQEDVTVKRIQLHQDNVTLFPENPDYSPIIVPSDRLEIVGKVVGLMRPYN